MGLKPGYIYEYAANHTPFNIPLELYTFRIGASRVNTTFYAFYGATTDLPEDEVKARIADDIKILSSNSTTSRFLAFASHTPFKQQVSADAVANGFYDQLNALQGYRGMHYTGNALDDLINMQNGTSSKTPVASSNDPIFRLWQPNIQLKHLFYGHSSVNKHLCDVLPSPSSKVLILTGQSLATKTPLVKELQALLKEHHAATFSGIRQHGHFADVDVAQEIVLQDDSIDTILSLGGGSPIDSAKTIAYRVSEIKGKWLTHITIPTTLSAAECTAGGGYTKSDGVKVGFMAPEMAVKAIFYDPYYASFTPKELWLSTGMRAMDHVVECFYHPYASEIWKVQSLWAAHALFDHLPKARDSQPHDFNLTTQLQIAAFLSSGLKGGNLKGGMGLSHSLGHALGSPYGIPHGVTSCLTLGLVVKFKAQASEEDAR
ncbi:MAG: hypothetical protein Q9167_006044 [Letrouitia subvulpina]